MPPTRKAKPRSLDHAALGAAIRQLRREAGMSQEALAEAAEIHPTHVGGIERGVGNPSYATLLRLATALKTRVGTVAVLADEIGERAAGRV
jgi:transcriptional regulator with XRE-family HTH domain